MSASPPIPRVPTTRCPTAGEVFKDGVAFASGSGVDPTSFSFTPDDDGSYRIVLTVSDEDGGSAPPSRRSGRERGADAEHREHRRGACRGHGIAVSGSADRSRRGQRYADLLAARSSRTDRRSLTPCRDGEPDQTSASRPMTTALPDRADGERRGRRLRQHRADDQRGERGPDASRRVIGATRMEGTSIEVTARRPTPPVPTTRCRTPGRSSRTAWPSRMPAAWT